MTTILDAFERHKSFKAIIGDFILAFSEMEFGLGIIASFTEFNLLARESKLPYYLGLTLENKRKAISEYIDIYEPNLAETWKQIDKEIDFLNKQRRFIAHGIERVYMKDSVEAKVKVGGKLESKELTIEEVKKWVIKLHHVNTGENGIIGSFYLDFVKRSFNRWNRFVVEEKRIVYKINSEIVTDWKGKGK